MGRLRYVPLVVVPILIAAAAAVVPNQRSNEQRYGATGQILEAPDHGPALCLTDNANASLELLPDGRPAPPRCAESVRMPIVGWDWNDVPDEERRAGTTWTRARVEGRYDGESLLLTAPPGPPEPPPVHVVLQPACDDPTVVDATDGEDEFSASIRRDIVGLIGMWVNDDRSFEWEGPFTVSILVFPGNAREAEARVRDDWGGYLCVVERDQPTAEELNEVFDRLPDVLTQELLFVDAEVLRGVVEAEIAVVDEQARREVEEAFGEGVVEFTGVLLPLG